MVMGKLRLVAGRSGSGASRPRWRALWVVASLGLVGAACTGPPPPPVDTEAPVLSLPGDLVVAAEDESGAEVTWITTAADAVDGDVPVTCDPEAGSFFSVGDTTVSCEATDAAGNAASGSFTVTVTEFVPGDFDPPLLSLPDDIEVNTFVDAGIEVEFEATAFDAFENAAVDVACDPASGSVFARGVTVVDCSASDSAGNAAAGSFTVTVIGPGAVEVAPGSGFGCARLSNARIKCWGANPDGRLGNGTNENSVTPVAVSGIADASQVDAGESSACAVRTGGTVSCWGRNAEGQLGDGSFADSNVPVPVAGLGGVTDLSVGGTHACAVASGSVWCWGSNSGTLSIGTPIQIAGVADAVAVAAGFRHACALIADGTARCWGGNDQGQLGNGTTVDSATAVVVTGLQGATSVSAGYRHSCVTHEGGTLSCWGRNLYGGLGVASGPASTVPVSVPGIAGVSSMAAGYERTCVSGPAGSAQCWGYGLEGQRGDGASGAGPTPVDVVGVSTATAIEASYFQTCALLANGSIICWPSAGGGLPTAVPDIP